MKKWIVLLLFAAFITAQTGALAEQALSSGVVSTPELKLTPTVLSDETLTETADSETQKEAVPEITEPEATIAPAKTPEPTPELTPDPTPRPYFLAMKNESAFAMVEENGTLVYKVMFAKNGTTAKPSIQDGVTYLPFRYIFENILGYEGREEMSSFADIETKLKGKQFTYRMGEPFEIAYRETDDSDVVVLTTDMHADNYKFTYEITGDNRIKRYNTIPSITRDSVNGSTLMAIRYFSSKGLCYVEWEDTTKTILLSDSEEHAKTQSKALYQNNDNYITYSDIIEYEGKPVSLSNLINDTAYAVSRIGNYCLFLNKDKKMCYIDLKNRAVNIIPIENDEDIQIQQFSVYNGELYGIAVKEDGYTGELFNAAISFEGNRMIAANYRKITAETERAREFVVRNIGGGVYLYYTDKNSNMSLKMVNASGGEAQFVLLDEEKMENIDSFSIGKQHIVYYNVKDNALHCVECDGYKATEPYVYENESTDLEGIRFILTNASAPSDVFYYIAVSHSDGAEMIKKIDFSPDDPKLVINGNQFSHMAVINSKLYAKSNDDSVLLLDDLQ